MIWKHLHTMEIVLPVFIAFALTSSAPVIVDAQQTQSMPQTQSATSGLLNTSWQFVKFQGGDGKILTPDNRLKYTVTFENYGRVSVRFDCNRGHGRWTSSGPNQIQFRPMGLTRAMCPPGSLHDHFVKNWEYIRSYVIKDGHLFLSLMADGGIFEFEPLSTPQPEK